MEDITWQSESRFNRTCRSCVWTRLDRLTGIRHCDLPEEHDPLSHQWDQMEDLDLDPQGDIDPEFGRMCYWHSKKQPVAEVETAPNKQIKTYVEFDLFGSATSETVIIDVGLKRTTVKIKPGAIAGSQLGLF
jgi:hypothetical protein